MCSSIFFFAFLGLYDQRVFEEVKIFEQMR